VPARDLIEETLILARNISYLSPPYKSQDLLPGSYTVKVADMPSQLIFGLNKIVHAR
jgi:hypothetical protein